MWTKLKLSQPDADGIPVVNEFAEGNAKRPYQKRNQQPVRRGWSMETWSSVRLDIPPPEPFAFLFQKKAMKTVVRREPFSMDSTPYTRSELLEILGMFPEAPPSAYEIKSTRQSRMDIAAGRFQNEKDPARRTKGGPSMVIDENYLYSFESPKILGGPHRKERTETLEGLYKVLLRIAEANLGKAPLAPLNRKFEDEAAVQKLCYEQTIRSVEGFNELTYLIKAYYDRVHEKIVRDWKHANIEAYYHPNDRLAKDGYEESVRQQLTTFTEVNVNSWAEDDKQDPTIVYSNTGGSRILANNDPDLPFDQRMELEFEAVKGADQLGFANVEEAQLSMAAKYTNSEKSNEDWEAYLESQIATLGEAYLGGGKITVSFDNKVWNLLFKLKDDPEEGANAIFQNNGVQKVKRKELDRVFNTIVTHLEKERDNPGSSYYKLLYLKKELALRKLRFEIIDKINAGW
jgi:hypothetical protein